MQQLRETQQNQLIKHADANEIIVVYLSSSSALALIMVPWMVLFIKWRMASFNPNSLSMLE